MGIDKCITMLQIRLLLSAGLYYDPCFIGNGRWKEYSTKTI